MLKSGLLKGFLSIVAAASWGIASYATSTGPSLGLAPSDIVTASIADNKTLVVGCIGATFALGILAAFKMGLLQKGKKLAK